MKKSLLITLLAVLGSVQAMALSEKCRDNLILMTAQSIVQNHQQKLINLELKTANVVQMTQSQLDGNVWVDTVIVDIQVKPNIGSYAYSAAFEIRGGKCASAKLSGEITKRGVYYGNDSGGQVGGD